MTATQLRSALTVPARRVVTALALVCLVPLLVMGLVASEILIDVVMRGGR